MEVQAPVPTSVYPGAPVGESRDGSDDFSRSRPRNAVLRATTDGYRRQQSERNRRRARKKHDESDALALEFCHRRSRRIRKNILRSLPSQSERTVANRIASAKRTATSILDQLRRG